ncbi:hypothetical protein DFA_01943 [Cavenderia fasciculata]|uniref:ComC supersandwich domain-containing protein n=1 Tax=Cavenderia fasciculata TaxID=261658 RepID=F4PQU6_CACFS|nr:uncharacterized protein DFA_01943 [Cavenderia fasciculata]EGG22054.1 hypothetical protein DFA_01943 [Cavenderia fasciculata]|eukprot:XP_004359905.1 hypothetical protein DFA_01943 [Cavenderia fasciculata]
MYFKQINWTTIKLPPRLLEIPWKSMKENKRFKVSYISFTCRHLLTLHVTLILLSILTKPSSKRMKLSLSIFTLFLLLLLLLNSSYYIKAQTLSQLELDSAIFIIKQYGIEIPQNQSLCNYGSPIVFECINSSSDNTHHINKITITGNNFIDVGTPNVNQVFDFPRLDSFYLTKSVTKNYSINILEYFKNAPSIKSFYINGPQTTVPNEFFSIMTNLTTIQFLTLQSLPNVATVIVNIPTCEFLYDLNISNPETLTTLYMSGPLTTWFPKDFKLYQKLASLSFNGINFTTENPIIDYPPNLFSLAITNTNMTTFPQIPLPKTLGSTQLFSNNFTTFPWDLFQDSKQISPIDVSENRILAGTVPESMCKFKLKIQNTSITSVPSCFWCYQWTIQTSLLQPPNFICPVTFDNQTIVTRNGQALVYGSNLGYGIQTINYTLTLIIPNSVLNMKIPSFAPFKTSQPQVLSVNLSTNANTSYNLNVIEAGVDILNINNVDNFTYTQQPSNLQIKILFASLNPNLQHQVGLNSSLPCNIVSITTNYIICNTSIIPDPGSYNITISNQYYQSFYLFNFIPKYPTVTAGIINDNNNNNNNRSKLISLYGYYGNLNYSNTLVLINNTLICNIGFINDRLINCTIETINQNYGPASINVQIDNLQYFKNDVLYFYPPNKNNNNTDQLLKQCQETTLNCFGNGQCNEFGKCDCIENYNPIDNCLTKYFNSSVNTTTDPLKPTTSFDINGVDFQFEIVSIQELNSENDDMVQQLIVDKWNSTITTINSTTIANYYLIVNQSEVTMPLLNVSAVISYSPKARTTMFGGNEIEMNPNSIKLSIEINNWEFNSNINSLRVLFKTSLPNNQSIEICQQASDEIKSISYDLSSSSIQYLRVLKDGIQFTGRFLDYIVSDGRNTYSRTQLVSLTPSEQSTTESIALIGILLPQCQSCIIDPDFTPLLVDTSQSQCGDNPSNNNTWKIIVGVTIGGSIFIAAIIGAIIYAKKYTNLKYNIFKLKNLNKSN